MTSSPPGGTGRRADDGFRTVSDILAAARECLAPELWDHAEGGAGTEATIRRNRDSLDEIRFRPRVLRYVAERSTATTILGMPATAPVALAPVGPVDLYDPDGALASARAAAAWGTLSVVSMTSSPALESLLTLIHDELLTAMAVLGTNNLQALTPDLVATP